MRSACSSSASSSSSALSSTSSTSQPVVTESKEVKQPLEISKKNDSQTPNEKLLSRFDTLMRAEKEIDLSFVRSDIFQRCLTPEFLIFLYPLDNAMLYLNYIIEYFESQKQSLVEILKKDEKAFSLAYITRGMIHTRQNDMENACKDYAQFNRLNPRDNLSWINDSKTLLKLIRTVIFADVKKEEKERLSTDPAILLIYILAFNLLNKYKEKEDVRDSYNYLFHQYALFLFKYNDSVQRRIFGHDLHKILEERSETTLLTPENKNLGMLTLIKIGADKNDEKLRIQKTQAIAKNFNNPLAFLCLAQLLKLQGRARPVVSLALACQYLLEQHNSVLDIELNTQDREVLQSQAKTMIEKESEAKAKHPGFAKWALGQGTKADYNNRLTQYRSCLITTLGLNSQEVKAQESKTPLITMIPKRLSYSWLFPVALPPPHLDPRIRNDSVSNKL